MGVNRVLLVCTLSVIHKVSFGLLEHNLLSPQPPATTTDATYVIKTLQQLVADERSLRIALQNDVRTLKEEITGLKANVAALQERKEYGGNNALSSENLITQQE